MITYVTIHADRQNPDDSRARPIAITPGCGSQIAHITLYETVRGARELAEDLVKMADKAEAIEAELRQRDEFEAEFKARMAANASRMAAE
jgi:hypothetical protein